MDTSSVRSIGSIKTAVIPLHPKPTPGWRHHHPSYRMSAPLVCFGTSWSAFLRASPPRQPPH
ncbi:MAG: hypothetical protein U0T36_09915 [Saprospiraceae bacterium]